MTAAAQERANAGLHEHVAAELRRLAPDLRTRILDVGCGTGAFIERLRGLRYQEVKGIDIDASFARARGLTVAEGDLDDAWCFESAAFDLCVAIEVVEHVESVGAMLRELARVLKPGGHALITTPNVHSVEARLRFLLKLELKQFDRLGDAGHVSPLILYPFTRLAGRHGFDVTKVWGHPVDGRSPTSRPALRRLAAVLRWLGVRDAPAGDQLCLLLRKHAHAWPPTLHDKREAATAHHRLGGRTPPAQSADA